MPLFINLQLEDQCRFQIASEQDYGGLCNRPGEEALTDWLV